MARTMRAGVVHAFGKPLTIDEVPIPTPGPGEVLIKVVATGVCHTDLHAADGDWAGRPPLPFIPGHEGAGVISAVGNGVSRDLLGKRAAIIPLIPDFTCEQCLKGHYSACHHYSFIGSRQSGGFAEYVEMPERNALIVPEEISFEQAALIEPSTVARHILDLGHFTSGQSAVVLGAGSIGLMTVQWLRILGAKLIICTDVVDANLETAPYH